MSKKDKVKKTNALRILDTHHIAYEITTFTYVEGQQAGMHAAAQIGKNPKSVFKTLVTYSDTKDISVFCIPVCNELDLKAAALASGYKSLHMLPLKDLLSTTGYIHGGCSPIGMKKLYPTYIDSSALSYDKITLSGGQRGLQMTLSPKDLAMLIHGQFVTLTHH